MNKDSEIKISLNLDKLVKDSKENEKLEINKKRNIIVEENKENNKEKVQVKKRVTKPVSKTVNNTNSKKDEKKQAHKKKQIKNKENNVNLDDVVELVNKHNEKINEERRPRVGKTFKEAKKEIIEDINNDKKKRVSIKRLFTSIFLIALIIIVYLFLEYSSIIGIKLPTNLNKDINVDIVSTENDIYKSYNNELLVYSNHVISTYNKKGKKTWEYSLETSFNPNIYVYENYMAITNNSNGIVYLFNKKNEILNMKVDGRIENIYMDNSGNMAIEYSTNSYKKIIGVYNSKGKNLYNSYLEYTSIIDIKLLDNANKLLVVQADANSFKIGATISILDGSLKDNNISQILKLDNNYIYNIVKENNKLVMLLDNGIISYDMNTNEKKELKKFDSSQVLFVAILDKYYVYIEKSLEDNAKYNMSVKDFNNVEISNMNIENSPKIMESNKFLNYLVYQNKLQIINKWGIEVLSEDLSMVPKDIIIFNNNKSSALIYTNKIEIINL